MSVVESDIQWFIARDGKQHGPLSDAEMRKLVELDHLRPTDLLWRLGFPDWRPANVVFPPKAPAGAVSPPENGPAENAPAHEEPTRRSGAQQPQQQQPSPYVPARDLRQDPMASRPLGTPYRASPGPDEHRNVRQAQFLNAEPLEEKRRGTARKLIAAVLLAGLIGGGGWFGFTNKEQILALVYAPTGADDAPPVIAAPRDAAKTQADDGETQPATFTAAAITQPPASASTSPDFFKRPLWSAVKQEFPEWYDARVAEADHLSAEGKGNEEIMGHLVQALVTLRRENAQAALAASAAKHKELAAAFLENLKQLAQESGEGCYDFISKGESSPFVVARMQDAEKSVALEAQIITIISAISEGKKTPVTHSPPVKADYDVLATELTRLGWSPEDMQLFADPRALAGAPRDRVCKMLQDWFSAHLSIPDAAVQERLLFETLKPVVSG